MFRFCASKTRSVWGGGRNDEDVVPVQGVVDVQVLRQQDKQRVWGGRDDDDVVPVRVQSMIRFSTNRARGRSA